MADENTNTNADANAAAASTDSPISDISARMYDADPAGSDNQNSKDSGEQKQNDDAEKNPDADPSGAEDKADEADKSEESDAKEQKDDAYADVVLPQDLPEGLSVDTERLDKAKEIAAKHKIPAEALKELVDIQVQAAKDAYEAAPKKIIEQWAEIESGWKKEAAIDKEIGGEKLQVKKNLANKAVEMFAKLDDIKDDKGQVTGNSFKAVLDQFRLGNNPAFIRVFSRIGEAISEGGSFERGNGEGSRTAADVLFDNTKK